MKWEVEELKEPYEIKIIVVYNKILKSFDCFI